MKKEQLIPGRVYLYYSGNNYKYYIYWTEKSKDGRNINYLLPNLYTVGKGNFAWSYEFKEVDEDTSRIVKHKLGITQDQDVNSYNIY